MYAEVVRHTELFDLVRTPGGRYSIRDNISGHVVHPNMAWETAQARWKMLAERVARREGDISVGDIVGGLYPGSEREAMQAVRRDMKEGYRGRSVYQETGMGREPGFVVGTDWLFAVSSEDQDEAKGFAEKLHRSGETLKIVTEDLGSGRMKYDIYTKND